MYLCSDCGNESLKWQGQCPSCKAWNTLKEFKEAKINTSAGVKGGEEKELKKLETIKTTETRIQTSSQELNTVLGGGIVQGSVVLLSGEPGIGKSTLTLQLANWVDEDIVYISGEETEHQIFERSERLKVKNDKLSLLAESNIENILTTLQQYPTHHSVPSSVSESGKGKDTNNDPESSSGGQPKVLVIDSISVMHSDNISGVSGSISQVRYITELIVAYAKTTNTAVFIIGHVTKDGNLAGPKTLEHMVDTVLYFEGDSYDNLRILRSLKNRFGTTSEVALYTMTETGLQDLSNPGLEFIETKDPSIGSSLSITMEGNRPIIIETESLTTYTKFGYPKRSARGINTSKLDLIIAVLSKYTSIKLESYDVYTNIARGFKIDEPGIDLSIAASIISSKLSKTVPKDMIFIGEISLTGNIKPVMHMEKRIKEAKKMGFAKIIGPKGEKDIPGIEIIALKNISELPKYL